MAPRQELILPPKLVPPKEEVSGRGDSSSSSASTASAMKEGETSHLSRAGAPGLGSFGPDTSVPAPAGEQAMAFRPFYPTSSTSSSTARLPATFSSSYGTDPPIYSSEPIAPSSTADALRMSAQDRFQWTATAGGSHESCSSSPPTTAAPSGAPNGERKAKRAPSKAVEGGAVAATGSQETTPVNAAGNDADAMGIMTTTTAPNVNAASYDPNGMPVYNSYGGGGGLMNSYYGGAGTAGGLLGGMMGGYGGGGMMYPPSPFMSPYGMTTSGPLSSLNQFLFGVQSVVFSLGQAVAIMSANASAIQQLLDAAMAMFDHAVATWHELKVLDQKKNLIRPGYIDDEQAAEESEEDRKRRRRLKALRYAVMTAASYAGYRLVRRAVAAATSGGSRRGRIDHPAPHYDPHPSHHPPHHPSTSMSYAAPPHPSYPSYSPPHPTAPYYSP